MQLDDFVATEDGCEFTVIMSHDATDAAKFRYAAQVRGKMILGYCWRPAITWNGEFVSTIFKETVRNPIRLISS